jgi:hypothetical protein
MPTLLCFREVSDLQGNGPTQQGVNAGDLSACLTTAGNHKMQRPSDGGKPAIAVGIGTLMPGTLHIFRLKPDPLQYQANYNLGANSWVQVFDPEGLDEFLRHSTALPPEEVEAMLDELRTQGRTTEAMVDIAEMHLGEMGFAESPSEV